MKKVLIFVLCVVFMLSSTAAFAESVPTVADLFAKGLAQDYSNFKATGQVFGELEFSLGEDVMSMVINTHFTADHAGNNTHIVVPVNVNMFGATEAETYEVYAVKNENDVTLYTNLNGTDWNVSQNTEMSEAIGDVSDGKGFEGLTGIVNPKGDGYEVITTLGDLYAQFGDLVKMDANADIASLEEWCASMGIDAKATAAIAAAFAEARLYVTFDGDGRIVEIHTDCTCPVPVSDVDVELFLNIDVEFSDFGAVDPATVTVPSEVENIAVG